MFKAAKDDRETLASRVEAFKLARVLGGIGEREPNEIPQEKFTLTINIGEESTVIGGPVIDVTPGPQNLRKDELYEFTSGVIDAGDGLNDDLRAGYIEGVDWEASDEGREK